MTNKIKRLEKSIDHKHTSGSTHNVLKQLNLTKVHRPRTELSKPDQLACEVVLNCCIWWFKSAITKRYFFAWDNKR